MIDVSHLSAISLEALESVGYLQNRFDAKYLVPVRLLRHVIERHDDQLLVLEHLGSRSTNYSSTYFDTPDLRSYRDHVQGRRRRYKVRTRHYGRPEEGFLEIKLKLSREMTKKVRWAGNTRSIGTTLPSASEKLVNDSLIDHYGSGLNGHLVSALDTGFRRVTLYNRSVGDRITIDSAVTVSHDGQSVEFNPDYSIVEIKSLQIASPTRKLLLSLGLRPTSMSKYCVGVAFLHDGVRTNQWLPQLRKLAS